MTTFDFKEVRFVRGFQTVVSDFLSRAFKNKDGVTQQETDTPKQIHVDDDGYVCCMHDLAHPHQTHRESILGGRNGALIPLAPHTTDNT